MEDQLRKHVPNTWDLSHGFEDTVTRNSNEFVEIAFNMKNARISYPLVTLTRVQNIYTYGQFLLREQMLLALAKEMELKCDYYRVYYSSIS